MLGWLSNAQQNPVPVAGDAQQEDDTAEYYDEAPETPAPLFAVRAFKHAIWGTPKPGETAKRPFQPRRRTAARRDPHGPAKYAPAAPIISIDAQGRGSQHLTPQNSPARRPGILLTPGTAGKGRKTVSFEARQRALLSRNSAAALPGAKLEATPKDVPGRFPSPKVPKDNKNAILTATIQQSTSPRVSEPRARPASRNHPAEEAAAGGFQAVGASNKDNVNEKVHDRCSNPTSPSGVYWKSTHEAYASKSEMEMRRLVKKEQLAKKFAKFKDAEALKLREELAKERRKVELLEARVNEYAHRLGITAKDSTNLDGIKNEKRIEGKQSEAQTDTQQQQPPILSRQRERSCDEPASMDALRPRSQPSDHARGSLKATEEHISSDIWADIGDHARSLADSQHHASARHSISAEMHARPATKTRSLGPTARRQREPLGSATGNVLESRALLQTVQADALDTTKENVQEGTATAKRRIDTMGEERREAARKRLEERKRLKEREKHGIES